MEVLQDGKIFAGRYRVLRRLASGGMGTVYVAVQEATELKVALKVLWPHLLQSKDATERFKLEARVAARIQSEHIVKVFDAGYDEASQMPFLVMELLEGKTLEAMVEEDGPLPFKLVVELLSQAARALDKAHTCRDIDGALLPIVHRDLKPDNLFVTVRENGEQVLKILDFGIAKILSQSNAVTQMALGTPSYMAVEQALGDPVSAQTDIWALGLIAYYLMTGDGYWNSTRETEGELRGLFAEIISLPLEPASMRAARHTVRPLPAGFDAWFERCVNRDPKQRFGSASQAIGELAACLLGAPPRPIAPALNDATTQASPEGPWRPAASWLEQRTGSGSDTIQDDTMTPSVVGKTTGRRPILRLPYAAAAVFLVVVAVVAGRWWVATKPSEVAVFPAAAPLGSAAPAQTPTLSPPTPVAAPAPVGVDAAQVSAPESSATPAASSPPPVKPRTPARVRPPSAERSPRPVTAPVEPARPKPPNDPLAGPRRGLSG
ncbi:MAG: hypothetical protein RJA70_2983 [Pseudomonadota bacterium]|jgi:serine/threonine-protein kinase